jgi:hypothetical protein
MCSKTYYCSGFNFDPKEKVCQLGSIHSSQTATPADMISVYLNSDYVEKGNSSLNLRQGFDTLPVPGNKEV